MIFRTYNKDGLVLLDNTKAVFTYLDTFKPKRLFDKAFANNKREVWYRAKRMGINSKMRQRWADIHTPEYCMYYIDIPKAISPIAFIITAFDPKDSQAFMFLNTGFFDNKTRMMFYSNGRLSDGQLEKTFIQVYDTQIQREDRAGINIYDKQGNLTFSSKNKPLDIKIKNIHIDGVDTGLMTDTEFNNQIKKMNDVIISAQAQGGMYHQNGMSHANYIWNNHLKPKLQKKQINLQDEIDKAFNQAGFVRENNLYIYKIGGREWLTTGNLEITYHILTGSSTEKRKLLYSVMSHDDIIVVKPTVKFNEIHGDGSVKPVNTNPVADLNKFYNFGEYIVKIDTQDLTIKYTKATNF